MDPSFHGEAGAVSSTANTATPPNLSKSYPSIKLTQLISLWGYTCFQYWGYKHNITHGFITRILGIELKPSL